MKSEGDLVGRQGLESRENAGFPPDSADDCTGPVSDTYVKDAGTIRTPTDDGRVMAVRTVLEGVRGLIDEAIRALDRGDVEGALRMVSARRHG